MDTWQNVVCSHSRVPSKALANSPPANAAAVASGSPSLLHFEQPVPEVESLTFDADMSFVSFLASLPRRILACKTKFSRFLSATFHLQRSGVSASSSALFPLPLPYLGVFDGSGPKLARKRCKRLMLKRGVHVIAMCLNYVFSGGKWIPFAELRRPPSPSQRATYDRIRRLLSACGSLAPRFPCVRGAAAMN